MIVDVLLESQRLIVVEATTPEELQSLTYINIVRVLPITMEQRNFSVDGAPILYERWYARLIDATNTQLDIPLGDLASQPGWTNDQAGYDQAEEDIYAAFPSGGGGGSGTVTSVGFSPGASGFGVTGSPVTVSGTITLTGYAAVRTGSTLWVDYIIGNDGTALTNRQDKPFLTIMGALASAASGDEVIVRPGFTFEAVDDSSAPATLYLTFEPGSGCLSLDIGTTGNWTVTGGTFAGDITMATGGGGSLILQTVTMGNLLCTDFDTVFVRECYINSSMTASNGGSIEIRNSFVVEDTVSDGSPILSYNTQHRTNASITNGGSLTGYASSLLGTVTDDPVIGDFFDGDPGDPGDVATENSDGTWGWAPSSAGLGSFLTLNDTDSVIMTAGVTTYYQNDGTGQILDPGNLPVNYTARVVCGVAATQITMVPDGLINGMGSLVLTTAACGTVTHRSGGNYIISGN